MLLKTEDFEERERETSSCADRNPNDLRWNIRTARVEERRPQELHRPAMIGVEAIESYTSQRARALDRRAVRQRCEISPAEHVGSGAARL